jgi:peptidylprolyl isomerase
VIEGMQYVDAIHEGEPPADPSIILQASIESDGKPPVTALPTPPAPSIVAPPVKKPVPAKKPAPAKKK